MSCYPWLEPVLGQLVRDFLIAFLYTCGVSPCVNWV